MKTIVIKGMYYLNMIRYYSNLYLKLYNPIKLNKFRNKPEFLIIGAMKSGTTYAFNLLKQHPQLNLPQEKEIHYFDIDYKYGRKWYNNKFPLSWFSKTKTGEASPYYLYHPLSPERAYNYNPNFKIIVLLRNPAYRAISHFNMIKNIYKVDLSSSILNKFEEELIIQEIIEKNIISKKCNENRIHRYFSFIRRGLYLAQIKKWEEYFPKENFLILKSEDLYDNPIMEMNKVCEFINIEKFLKLNENVYKYIGNYEKEIDDEIIKKLKIFFQPYNKELEIYLNREFNWG